MTNTQIEVEKLRTLQEFCNDLADKIEVQLPAIADKIDNIKLPEIDTTELAKQGENQEATNTAIYNLLNKSAIYDRSSGNLTIENVNITIL